jgi:hypothetical protein
MEGSSGSSRTEIDNLMPELIQRVIKPVAQNSCCGERYRLHIVKFKDGNLSSGVIPAQAGIHEILDSGSSLYSTGSGIRNDRCSFPDDLIT